MQAFLRDLGPKVLDAARKSPDSRVRAFIDPMGAATGRLTCSSPNLLGLPKDREIRAAVVAAPGSVFVVADYAAIDLRVLADVADDERLRAVFRAGGDPHRATAAQLLQKAASDVTSDERQKAKAVNFGFAFGMGPAAFVDAARASYGVEITLEEATAFRDAYLAAHPGVHAWQTAIKRTMPVEVRTRSGRRRRFASSKQGYCERLNTEVQGTAADGMKRALVLAEQRLRGTSGRIVLCVHDEVLVECAEADGEAIKQIVVEAMRDGMSCFVKSVPIEVDAHVRSSWAQDEP